MPIFSAAMKATIPSIGVAALFVLTLPASPAEAQNGRWCQANPERCARLKQRIRTRCRQDPAWCARLRERIRARRAARSGSGQGTGQGRDGQHAGGLKKEILRHNGTLREYWWMTPARVRGKAPLVVVLHGGRGRALQVARYTQFNAQARASGFTVVYPQGVQRRWNDGRRVNRSPNTDDVGFLRLVVQSVIAKSGRVDPRRVFFTGISNGGFMSMRMACNASDLVAGIAAVTAQFNAQMARRCLAAKPVPVLLMNGTRDPLVPYNGGPVAPQFGSRGVAASTAETLAFWRRRNGCKAGATAMLPDRSVSDGSRIERTRWTACRTGAPVILYKVIGGGHTWPGKKPYLSERWIGKTSRDIDGTAHIWRFFASLPRRR